MSGSKQNRRRKKEVGKSRRAKAAQRRRKPTDALRCFRELSQVFGDHSKEMLRLATQGASPEKIAQELGISEAEAQRFIDTFVALPGGIDEMFLRVPSLLDKGPEVRALVRSALKEARRSTKQAP